MKRETKAYLALTSAAIFWGLTPIMSINLLPYGTPLTFVTIRMFTTSFTIMAFLLIQGKFFFPPLKQIPILLLLGILCVCLSNNLTLIGLKYSTVTNYSLISLTSPFFIAIIGFLFFQKKLLNIQWLGLFITFVSVTYIVTDGDFAMLKTFELNFGDIFFLIMQVSWAFYTIISSKILQKMSLFHMIMWSTFFGSLLNTLYGGISGDLQVPILNGSVLLSLAYNSWVSSMAGLLLWLYGVSIIDSSISGSFMNISTLVGIASGILFLGEQPKIAQFVGTLGILFGIYLLTQYHRIDIYFKNRTLK